MYPDARCRERRIKRAIEISLKKKYLPADIQKLQQPLKVGGWVGPCESLTFNWLDMEELD